MDETSICVNQGKRCIMKKVIQQMYLSPIREITIRANELAEMGKDVISFGTGDSDFNTPEIIRRAAKDAIDANKSHYETIWGNETLRDKIRKFYKKNYHVSYEMEEVMITAAGTEAIFDIFLAFVEPGDEVIVLSPAFINYENGITLAGGKTIFVPLLEKDEFLPDMKKLREAITAHTRMIVINNPCNPTGVVYPLEILQQIAQLAQENDLLVFADEVYDQILYNNTSFYSLASFPGMKERTIVANSFSKTLAMTGWRVGYVLAEHALMESLYKVHHYATACQPTFIQEALAQTIDLPEIRNEQQKMVKKLAYRRKMLTDWLKKHKSMTFIMPQGAFYVFVNVSGTGMDGRTFALRLLEKKQVAVVPGIGLGAAYGAYIRISYAVGDHKLQEGMKRMEQFLCEEC